MSKKATPVPSEKDLALKEQQMSKEKPDHAAQSPKNGKKKKQKANRR